MPSWCLYSITISLQRSILPPPFVILHPSSERSIWAHLCPEAIGLLYHPHSSQDGSSIAEALPEGSLPTQGGGGGAPALPIFLSLCFLLSQRSRDISCLIAFVGEVLVKRHCWFWLTMGSPPSRHVIFLHIWQLPMWQVRFRVTSSPWGREDGCWESCWASRKVPNGRYTVLGMWSNLWVPGIPSSNYLLNNLTYHFKLVYSEKSSQF